MGWIIAIGLAIATFAAMLFVLKMPRGGREFAAAALLVGLAGYALQGSPSEPGSPTQPRENAESGQATLVEARRMMDEEFGEGRNYLITADAYARAGQFGAASSLLRGAVRKNPDDPDLWLALGNALVGHTGGIITPAALYAFQKASDIAPTHPGPPFFTGLALAQSGQFEDARKIWQELLNRPVEDGDDEWRADLSARLARLEAIIAMQSGAAGPVPVEQDTPPATEADSPPS
ncbi:tetratricopeptide repeat protein [Croceicoccus naphthovorans]|uniref:Cytochrome C biosynthesis protein n=1 Tax=Croceicoccus naphthovorans TaxID=1348774 RepID=A0A0G3XGF1_9SPHN|nr:tetratricopeptide repeat protein [Croceicoccus naphthovorans]AKM10580.1 cytochrome C biosynthesis protein [Croceicoccus naphthovorans]MBB3988795.1 cytochrome c-type biogenesis protein CcmH [Croceicoccus naphthovorans]